jgi:plastocyanin domain-containing protein
MTHRLNWKSLVLAGSLGFALSGTALSAHADDKKPAPAPAAAVKKAGQTVEMKVTAKGFEPDAVTVKKGEPVTLVITRTVERTCATEIVIDEHGIKTKLPMNKPVTVTFTPNKAGELKYGCAMNKMIGGVLTVQ